MKKIIKLIQKEIDYHESIQNQRDGLTSEFKGGFIEGMKHILDLINKVKKSSAK